MHIKLCLNSLYLLNDVCFVTLVCPSQESHEHFLVLFSFHLLILSLDHSQQDFIYEVILSIALLINITYTYRHSLDPVYVAPLLSIVLLTYK